MNSVAPLPWQSDVWARLRQAGREDHLPHALLLQGQTGLGKGHLARAFAQALLCKNNGDVACGECSACHQFVAGSSPDFFAIEPLENKKTISVDQVRELIEALTLSSHGNGRRVTVINPADAMNVNAANSLLKTLEEPPGQSVLMLVSARPARLPATIRSRCRQLRFAPPEPDVAIPWLVAQGVDEAHASHLLQMAGRRPLRALALNDETARTRTETLPTEVGDIVLGKRNPVAVAKNWSQEPLAEVLELLIMWAATLIQGHFATGKADAVAERLGARRLFAMLDHLYEAEKLRDTAINQQLLLESILAPLAPGS